MAAAILLAALAGLAGSAAYRESVAIDEIAHIGAGLSYWQKLDLRMNPEHPPLAKLLAAAPLALLGARADYHGFAWTFGGQGPFNPMLAEWPFGASVVERWNGRDATVRWARFPMLLILLATGLAIFRFGERLSDGWGGAFALCWFATMPTFLAFGPLVLTDTAVALFSLMALWTFATMWKEQTRGSTLRFAAALAMALLTKFSAGLLLFVFAAYPLVLRWLPLEGSRRGWRLVWKGVLWAGLMVYAVEFVLSWNEPTDALKFIGGGWAALALRRLLLPVVTYVGGVALFAMGSVRPTYLLGRAYPHGVWFFFPVVTLLKSTLAFLVALALAIGAGLAGRWGRTRASGIRPGMQLHWRALWLGMAIVTLGCLMSPMTISIRHFTVPLALAALLMAPVPRLMGKLPWGREGKWAAAALAVASLATVALAWPYYVPFLNSLAGGRPGYELVSDSNLDWDTELPDVERFIQARGLRHVLVDSYNFADPSEYVPQGRAWECQAATAADGGSWAIVSANEFYDGENCAWLLAFPKEALAGGGMYAVHLPETIPAAGSPGGPPLPRDYRYFGGGPFDMKAIFNRAIGNPREMPGIMAEMSEKYAEARGK